MKMQKSILPKFEISIFEKMVSGKYEIFTSQLRKNAKSAPQNLKLDCDLEFSSQKSIFENPKSISPIPFESCFET